MPAVETTSPRFDDPASPARLRMGIDIGGSKTQAAAVDATGSVRARALRPTDQGPRALVECVVAVAQDVAGQLGVTPAAFGSIGVGVPGVVDRQRGRVAHAVNLGVTDLALRRVLETHLGAPVALENDVNAAALGAYAARGDGGSLAYLNLGTGLAAGLVLDGRLWRGAGGLAGEIGHLPYEHGTEPCGCGLRGCLETVASGRGVRRRWADPRGLPVLELFRAADDGEPEAVRARQDVWRGVASAVRVLVLSSGVDVVLLGGGLSGWGEPLLAGVVHVLDEWSESSALLDGARLSQRVGLVPDSSTAAVVGAAMIGQEVDAWRS